MKRLFISIAAIMLLLILTVCFNEDEPKSTYFKGNVTDNNATNAVNEAPTDTTNDAAKLTLEPAFEFRSFDKPVGLEHLGRVIRIRSISRSSLVVL
jgi:hypothetical protein